MKIAFDAKRAFRNYSGLGNYSRTIIRDLHNYFPENEYLLFTPNDQYQGDDFPPNGSRIILPTGIYKNFRSYWRSYKISDYIREEGVNIYHGLSHELPKDIEKSGAKSIVSIHDLIFFRFPELYPFIDRKIYHHKYKHATEKADKIIAISEQTKRDIVEYLNVDEKKIEVVYQSSNPSFNQHLSKNSLEKIRHLYNLPSDYILSVGTIEERKNVLQLLKAVHLSGIDIPIVIVGKEKKYAEKVKKYISENNLKNIIFLKNLPAKDLPGIYQLATLFAYPSSFEGFGIPVLEALQSGTPVIAAKGSCLEETGGKHSMYVNPFDVEEFGNIIKTVLESQGLQDKMISEGLSYAKKFGNENAINSLYKLYESL